MARKLSELADVKTELGQEEARTGAELPKKKGDASSRRRRRPFMILLAIVAGVLVYGLAFQQTEVNLEEIGSETRQNSLARILRALAQPDLVTYDTERNEVRTDVAVPCGPTVSPSSGLTVTPQCASPGETVTVEGTGFPPGQAVAIEFVPDSEFVITLRLASIRADDDGAISADVVIPERESESPQQILAATDQPIGTWRNRVEVYTDSNANGVEDDPTLGESGTRTVTVEGEAEVPGVALIDPAGSVIQFLSTGAAFEANDGVANGDTAIPIDEDTLDVGILISEIVPSDGGFEVTVGGPPGADLSNWRIALYDGVTGESQATTFISDTIELSPRISETAIISLDKILETVFLALIATTAGIVLAIPFSFVSARNLMRDISIPVTNLALILLAVPVGGAAGIWGAQRVRILVGPALSDTLGSLVGSAVTILLAWILIRAALPPADIETPSRLERLRRGGMLLLAGVLGLAALLSTAVLLQQVGEGLTANLGRFGFIGTFFSSIGEILEVALAVIAALAGAGVAANLAAKLGYSVRSRAPRPVLRATNLILAGAAGAIWLVLLAQIIDWLYQIEDPTFTIAFPAILGAAVGVALGLKGMHKGELAVGLSVYYASRTVFNTLRSIEPLVMAIVFVVWVGIGPFAGSLALALHTTAALAKLYSEQVESVMPGPIEAVRATGANRLQTIVYSVVPQIIPPYISFTMYRWDINVRMSTILGFVGGGGIGSILQQNINLFQYRAAAVQMLAIAIVVAAMDYASSRLRERFV